MSTPVHALQPLAPDQVQLLPGILKTRFELNRAYLHRLRSENLLQNHYFEAGIWGPPGKPSDDIHWGWESPNSMVRGHMVGHWLSAAARIVAATGDPVLLARANGIVSELARCQFENGGEWVAPIPEKYLYRLERGRLAWAAQYIVSKTFMGLWEMFAFTGNDEALDILDKATPWFHRWTMKFTRDEMDEILDYETCGMLEVWADLYGQSGSQEHLDLMERYDRGRLFEPLLNGEDVLTNRHANSTIPEVLGAARAYEVTGVQRYRDIVEAYWRLAVTDRGGYCTGGQTSNEIWSAPNELSARLGPSNQEHCTVYNMMRLAEYLLRWTGDVAYADYRERNLFNGILAQQNQHTGMVTYYLPMRAGMTKTWSTETASFWCCVATLVQAHSIHGTGTYYTNAEGMVVTGFVPAEVSFEHDGQPVKVVITPDPPPTRIIGAGQADLSRDEGTSHPRIAAWYFRITSETPVEMTLTIRLPWWVDGLVRASVDGEAIDMASTPSSFQTVRRTWTDSVVKLELPHRVVAVPLPDRPDTVAFMDGPVVLAGLCDEERTLIGDPGEPAGMLTADNERDMGGWWPTYRTVGQDRGIRFVPLHNVVDEPYAIYFPTRPRFDDEHD